MLYIEADSTIRLTRGDTAYLQINITDSATGEAYVPGEADRLAFTVKHTVFDADPCLQKLLVGASAFQLDPGDTSGLEFGAYKYDIQLTTATGDVYTVLGPACFELMQEVTT